MFDARDPADPFETLFRKNYAPLCEFVHGYVRSQDAAQDIVQELFLAVWQKHAEAASRTPYIATGAREGQIDFRHYNAHGRMPAFHALDLRAEKRWSWRGLQLTTYLDIQDVYNRNNPIAYVWDARKHAPRYEKALGFLPSLGINIEF
jgi:DNA-directed RNA polymerase specialized sigma24 family protein